MPNLTLPRRPNLADTAPPPSCRDASADACDEAVVLIDADRRIVGWSRGARQLLGFASDEIIGRRVDALLAADERIESGIDQELETAARFGESDSAHWYQRRDGSRFVGSGIVMAIRNADGSSQGFVHVLRDVQSQDQLGRLLQQATEGNRLKDEMLSTVSHELRTPLNAILGWIQLLHLGKTTPERVEQALEVIERNAQAQARLIDDLLDMSRILSGKTRLSLAPVSLSVPLGAAIETIRPVAAQQGLTLTVGELAPDDVVLGDAGRLQQVISNVLANAVKFTRPGGIISVSTMSAGSTISLRVEDSGVGIDPSFVPFVFDRFRQGGDPATREQGGLGLGLSIVKHLMELHGGRVVLVSEGRDRGTTVALTLPAATDRRTRADDTVPCASARATVLSGRKVLIVDDDADGSEMLEVALTACGAQVRRAQTVRAAIEAVRAEAPEVVLSDLSMPGGDGFTLLSELRTEPRTTGSSMRIVAITGHARDEDRRRCLAAGFDDYVSKPVDLAQIISLVAVTGDGAAQVPQSLLDVDAMSIASTSNRSPAGLGCP